LTILYKEYKETTPNVINGVTFIQAINWGEKLGQLKIKVAGENGKWVVKSVNAMTHSVANVEEDQEYSNI
jgi:2',3'-cyclic-nucleotide 2'-phosphodiesterase (5'-nucleotidase family)